LLRVPSPVIFDHLAGSQCTLWGIRASDNGKLIDGKTWARLSGSAKVGPPSYSDTVPIAHAYIKGAPERMVWASDWPHPTEKNKPDDAVLFDLLTTWAPDETTRTRILVQNPATLYGFPSSA
jgi:predicted TIM-barrel fold metal-dependent hydrolase